MSRGPACARSLDNDASRRKFRAVGLKGTLTTAITALAPRAALLSAAGTLASVFVVAAAFMLGVSLGQSGRVWAIVAAFATALIAAFVAQLFIRLSVTRRVRKLARFIEQQTAQEDFLRRLPSLGHDEIGRLAMAINRLFAGVTTTRVSMIDQQRELSQTQQELAVQAALAAKNYELEQRLKERRLLFDVLRVSASSTDIDSVVRALADRLMPTLRLSRLAILVRTETGMEIRAVQGLQQAEAIVGRVVSRAEGLLLQAEQSRRLVTLPEISASAQSGETSVGSWDFMLDAGGVLSLVPIFSGKEFLGALALVRPSEDPVSETEERLLEAVADQAALAMAHARLFEELRRLSTHDELTGVPNRRLLGERLEREMERAKRYGQTLAVLVADLDHFKELNDRAGHAAGDIALISVAKTLAHGVRKVDTVARVGGEEFVLLLPQADMREAALVAEKLRTLVEKEPIRTSSGEQPLTLSFGVTVWDGSEDAAAVLRRADEAMYAAKRGGRNCVITAPPSEGQDKPGVVLPASTDEASAAQSRSQRTGATLS